MRQEGENPSARPASIRSEHDLETTRREAFAPDLVERLLVGPHGLRCGWSILFFAGGFYLFRLIIESVLFTFGVVGRSSVESPILISLTEMSALLALIGVVALMSRIEGRRILDYNLAGAHRVSHFLIGLATGFAALSLLVAEMTLGGWLRCAGSSLSSLQVLRFALLWAFAYLLVGMVEEGVFRCYTLFTLTRGINFWSAFAAEVSICLYALLRDGGNGVYGVYAVAALGAVPCLVLHWRCGGSSAFWQASWVTSTFFCFAHTTNGGENWVGVFAAGLIGFVFCVSVRVTGSAWWAIGSHAAWDWAETFFYGTADSGMRGQGHLLTATPVGNPIWSGGTDGPEGSLLVLGVILLLLLFLLVTYGRKASVSCT